MPCYDFSNFGQYFAENMNALGLSTPNSIFSSATVAYANIHILASAVTLYGRRVTVNEVWGTSGKLERLRAAPPILAAFYAGAAAGSAAVALGRSLGCNTTIADAITQLQKNGINEVWLEGQLRSNPQFVNPIR